MAVLAVMTLAVGAPTGPSPSTGPDATLAWGPMAVMADPADGGFDAAGGHGRVIVGNECITIRGPDGDRRTLVWRDGQSGWDASRRAIIFDDPDLGQVSIAHGDRIALGGASLRESGVYDEVVWVAPPADRCPEPMWVVHQVVFLER